MTGAGAPAGPADLVAGVFLPGRAGSLQLDLLGATRRRGLLPYVLPGMPGAMLAEVAAGRPMLALQNLGLDSAPIWHYAVIVGYDAACNGVVLRSGGRRRLAMSWPRFLRSWERGGRWSVVVLQPGVLPASAEPAAYLEACAGLEAAGMPDAAAAAYAAAAARWPSMRWSSSANSPTNSCAIVPIYCILRTKSGRVSRLNETPDSSHT